MRTNFRQAIIVGIFTLGSIVAAVFGMHYVRKGISASAYRVWALLPDADGLYTKSRVMIAGIVVGEIISIKLQNGMARLDLRIREDVQLYQNATIAKVSLGLLGDQAIVLTRGTKDAGKLPSGGQIKIVRKVGLMSNLQKMLPKVNKGILPGVMKFSDTLGDLSAGPASQGQGSLRDIAEAMRKVAVALSKNIDQNQQRVSSIIKSVDQLTRVVARLSSNNAKQISAIIRDIRKVTQNASKLSGEEKTMRETLRYVRDITKTMRDLAREMKPGSKNINQALKSLEKTLAQVSEISTKINKGKGSLGRLINDDKIVRKVEGAVTNIARLVSRISLMKTHIRWRADYFFRRSGFRNEVQLTLAPSPNKYYTIALVDDPRGVTNITRRVRRTTDPTKPPLINEEELVVTNSFRFSLQLNFRWWLFNFRGGVIESTAGFGVDLFPWKEYIKIRAEIFDFSNENLPRLRTYAVFNYRFFTISAGVDDVLNDGSRDFFVGAGLRFTDEDLLTLLPFLPTPR